MPGEAPPSPPAPQLSDAPADPGEFDIFGSQPSHVEPEAPGHRGNGRGGDNSWGWVIWAIVALAALAFYVSGFATAGHLLWFAAIAVGALAWAWFNDANGSRDKLFFIASAGAFLFLVALEYDNKLFNHLAKIGGGGVSVEFSDEGRSGKTANGQNPVPSVSSTADYLEVVFPGASGVDFSLGGLKEIPKNTISDEQYAVLLAGLDPQLLNLSHDRSGRDATLRAMLDGMEGPTKKFLGYACEDVVPFAAELEVL